MPVKGKIIAFTPERTVQDMVVGESGYVVAEEIVVTRKALFLGIHLEVLSAEEKEETAEEQLFEDFALIKRIGPGLSEEDFEIDFTALDKFPFFVEGENTFIDLSKETEYYIPFFNIKISYDTIVPSKNESVDEETLEQQLQKALDEQKYELAAEIRDKIAKRPKRKGGRK